MSEKNEKINNPIKVYFTYFDALSSRCKLCSNILKHHGNTTNLKNHIKRKHGAILESNSSISSCEPTQKKLCFANIQSTSASTSAVSEEQEREQEQPQIQNNFNKESLTSNLSAATTITLVGTSGSSSRSSLPAAGSVSSGGSGTPNNQNKVDCLFQKISSFSGGGKNASKVNNALVYMIAVDNLPFSTVENRGCRFLLKTVAPHYQPPSRKTMARLVDEKFSILSLKFKTNLLTIDNLTMTVDIWTDTQNTRSFMGITVHYCCDTLELKSVTIGVFQLNSSHTAEYIGGKLTAACDEWSIDTNKISAVVTDNGANMVKAIYVTFGKRRHLPCFAHTVNLIVTNSIKSTLNLKEIVTKVKDIVTFFKQSVSAADQLRSHQLQNGKTEGSVLKLTQECETRWNSMYQMLSRFLELASSVSAVLFNYRQPAMISHEEIEIMKEIVKIFEPFKYITEEICADQYVTCSKVIPIIHCLKLSLVELQPVSDIGILLINNLSNEINKRFYSDGSSIEKNEILSLATILDPRFKKIHFESPLAVSATIAKLANLMCVNNIDNNQQEQTERGGDNDNDNDSNSSINVWQVHDKLINSYRSHSDKPGGIPVELRQYLDQPVIARGENPIKYWDQVKRVYPALYPVAIKYLSIVATSVPCERLFSKAGIIMTDKRSRLKASRLSSLIFLSSLEEKEWFLN